MLFLDVTIVDKIYIFLAEIDFQPWIGALNSFTYFFFVFSSYNTQKDYFSIWGKFLQLL